VFHYGEMVEVIGMVEMVDVVEPLLILFWRRSCPSLDVSVISIKLLKKHYYSNLSCSNIITVKIIVTKVNHSIVWLT